MGDTSHLARTPTLGQYRQHDLMRLFARKVADPAQRRESPQALCRLREFYASSGPLFTGERDGTAA